MSIYFERLKETFYSIGAIQKQRLVVKILYIFFFAQKENEWILFSSFYHE